MTSPAKSPSGPPRVSRRQPLSELPFWPRYLSREEAARYLGVSVDVFDNEVRSGLWPRGRARGGKGGRLTWNRAVLDATSDQLDGLAGPAASLPDDAPPIDPGSVLDRRLEALAKRAH